MDNSPELLLTINQARVNTNMTLSIHFPRNNVEQHSANRASNTKHHTLDYPNKIIIIFILFSFSITYLFKVLCKNLMEEHTGTTNNVDKKLDKYESKYGCEFFCLPSISIVFGMSGTKLKAALKHASAKKIFFV